MRPATVPKTPYFTKTNGHRCVTEAHAPDNKIIAQSATPATNPTGPSTSTAARPTKSFWERLAKPKHVTGIRLLFLLIELV